MTHKCTPRERVLLALDHKEPDRIPTDFGSTGNTSITAEAYKNLKNYLNIDLPVKMMMKNLSVVHVDDVILERFEIDTRGVFITGSDGWRDITLSEDKYIDEWGVTYHKPKNAFFYEAVNNPLAGNITSKTLREYNWPDPHSKGRIRLLAGADQPRRRGRAQHPGRPGGRAVQRPRLRSRRRRCDAPRTPRRAAQLRLLG